MKDLLRLLAPDLGLTVKVLSVDAESPIRARRDSIDLLKNKDPGSIHIVTNCQLFTEGVDAPSLDAVAFFDPKQSTVGIIQAVGRALRYVEGKRAKVILPLFAAPSEDPNEFVQASRYKSVYEVATALPKTT